MSLENSPFYSAAPFYRYRSEYPAELFTFLAARLDLGATDLALDIGSGTGQIAIPLAAKVGRVIAIEPLPEMVEQARSRTDADNIEWLLTDSSALATLNLGPVRLAVFAASFHWMDRPAVVRDLDRLLETDGAIVVIGYGVRDEDQPDWVHAVDEIRAGYFGAHEPARLPPSHRDVLEASTFPDIEASRWAWSRQLTIEELVNLQFSYSFSAPALFGDRAEAFAAEVRDAVLALHPSGTVVEPNAFEMLIARRSR